MPFSTSKPRIEVHMALFGSDKFKCARCGQKNEPLGFAPIPTDLGQKIGAEICKEGFEKNLLFGKNAIAVKVIATMIFVATVKKLK